MIKASLDFHDPLDIYDYFKNEYGPLSMLIRQNSAFLTFQNRLVNKHILQNPKRVIKSIPLTIRAFDDEGPTRKVVDRTISLRSALTTEMDLEEPGMGTQDGMMLGESVQLPNLNKIMKLVGVNYETKLKEIKQKFADSQECNAKITEFNTFISKYINNNFNTFQTPFRSLKLAIKRFSLSPEQDAINLTQSNLTIAHPDNYSSRAMTDKFSPRNLVAAINYSSPDVASVKRLCLLNENNFITTVKLNDKNAGKGQLRIYKKDKQGSEFTLDIDEGPYSLMIHQNYILTGDQAGHIHFIDTQNQNACEYSNRLNPGLIVQMQNYPTKNALPSIITLFTGLRKDYKIKLFDIERQIINTDLTSLTFHPQEQILCEDITMTMEVLKDGKFAYGCGRVTYICPSFDKNERDYITHDHNVMKLRMKNSQQLIEATERKILLLDLRAYKLKNEVFDFKHDINNIQMLSEHYIFYGGKMGEVGVVDCRKPNVHVWNPPQILHQGKIADILRMGNDVISADGCGNILEWKNQQIK